VAAVFITVVLWSTNSPVLPKEPTWGDVLSEARSGGYQIITTEELRERYLKAPEKLLLVDTVGSGNTAPGTSRER